MTVELYHRVYPATPAEPGSARAGLGLPVVLIHGLMGYASNWGKIWPALTSERPVLVLDQRGHGRSPKPDWGYSPLDYARDIQALLNKLNWSKVHLVGHSMGGRTALALANLAPGACASLTLEDSGTEARPDRLMWIRNLLGDAPTPFGSRADAQAYFDRAYRDDPLVGNFLFANIQENAAGQWDWRFNAKAMIETVALGRARDASAEFRTLSCPALIIRGGNSSEFTADEAERMRALKPGTELVTVPGAGHFVHPTHPAEFLACLQSFLRKHDR